jgi:hypothetical protein
MDHGSGSRDLGGEQRGRRALMPGVASDHESGSRDLGGERRGRRACAAADHGGNESASESGAEGEDRSKMVLLEEPAVQAKRLLEQRCADKVERAAKSISRISLDVDKLTTKARKGCIVWGGRASRGEGDGAKNRGGVVASSKICVGGGGHGFVGVVARIAGRQWRPSIDREPRGGGWAWKEGGRGWKGVRRVGGMRGACAVAEAVGRRVGDPRPRRDRQNRAPLCSVDAYDTHLSSSSDMRVTYKILFLQ